MRGVERLTSTIVEVELDALSEPIAYLPGQYVLLEAPGGGLVPRSYSAANSFRPDRAITLLVTRVPDGQLSPWIYDDLARGDQVLLSGPYGSFIADPAASGPSSTWPPARGWPRFAR